MANLKSGTPLFFVADSLYPYWQPTPKEYKMDIIFESILEGRSDSYQQGNQEGKWVWHRQYCNDSDDVHIKPSQKGDAAGSYANLTETDSQGTLWIKVNFPFTFYNRDGNNHDEDSTIVAWVKSDEVISKADASKTLKEMSDSLGLNPNTGLTGSGGTNTNTSSKTILIIVAAILIFAGIMIFAFRKKPLPNQQGMPSSNPNSGINVIRIPKSS